jgi:hypothetical protein
MIIIIISPKGNEGHFHSKCRHEINLPPMTTFNSKMFQKLFSPYFTERFNQPEFLSVLDDIKVINKKRRLMTHGIARARGKKQGGAIKNSLSGRPDNVYKTLHTKKKKRG